MSNDQTTKQRFHSSAGQSVSDDYLLFACLQVEKLLKARNQGELKPNWPELDLEAHPPGSELVDSITDMLSWYKANHPILKTDDPIDYSRVAEFSEALVPMVNDLILLFQTHEIQLTEEWPKEGPQSSSEVLRADIVRMFPATCDKLIRYLDWTLSTENKEEFQIGDRPPVGRFAPAPVGRGRGPGGRGPGGPRRDGGGGGGNRDRGGNGPRGGGGNRERSGGGPRGGGGGGPDGNRRFGNERDGNRDQGRNRGGNRGGNRDRRPPVDPAIVEGRLRSEVEAAVEQMKAQGLDEISLRPQNSFNRRLQHNFVSEHGLSSTSRGDEPERFVVIVKAGTKGE